MFIESNPIEISLNPVFITIHNTFGQVVFNLIPEAHSPIPTQELTERALLHQ